MSSQKGNVSRTRKQKYQNSQVFKNNLHDTSNVTKTINSLSHEGICQQCKMKIEWKVKYKKYKPLSQPATCVRCHNKCVKRAYHVVCQPCAERFDVCAKCNQTKKIALPVQPSAQEVMAEEERSRFELMQLSERQRRTVLRFVEKGETVDASIAASSSSSKKPSIFMDDDFDFDNEEDAEEEDEDNEGEDNGSHQDVSGSNSDTSSGNVIDIKT